MPTKEQIQEALSSYGPQSVTSDGTTVVNRSIDDLNKAVEALDQSNQCKNPWRRVGIVRFGSEGPVSRE